MHHITDITLHYTHHIWIDGMLEQCRVYINYYVLWFICADDNYDLCAARCFNRCSKLFTRTTNAAFIDTCFNTVCL